MQSFFIRKRPDALPDLTLIPPLSDQNCPEKLLIQSLSDKLNVITPGSILAAVVQGNTAVLVAIGPLIRLLE